MTASSPFGRIGPVTWLVLQGVATVVSILLAFGINAWWDQRKAAAEKNVMLESVKAEMLSDLKWVADERVYRQAALENIRVLLKSAGAGRYDDKEKTLDHRLGDLTWISDLVFSTGAIDSLISSGRLAAVEDKKLRALLAEFRRNADVSAEWGHDESKILSEVIVPFLSRNANFLQISNEVYRHGRPGNDGKGASLTAIIPISETVNNTLLLKNREFAGVLIDTMWVHVDVADFVCDRMPKDIDEIVRRIDQEILNTS